MKKSDSKKSLKIIALLLAGCLVLGLVSTSTMRLLASAYNLKNGGYYDDISVAGEPERGWGWLIDRKFDIIQTDWCGMMKHFIKNRQGRLLS